MSDAERNLLRLRRAVVSEHLAEGTVHDAVQSLFDESIPVLLGLPHVDVTEAAFGTIRLGGLSPLSGFGDPRKVQLEAVRLVVEFDARDLVPGA